MPKTATTDIRRWARLGAEQRLHQLHHEIAAIHAAFPDLRRGRNARATAPGAPDVATTAAPKKRRRRRKLSADARKRISEAQKARWAKKKTEKK